jgi:hypothetical protein
LWITSSSLSATKIELGKARNASDSNLQNSRNWKKLYEKSDSEKVEIIKQNNDFVQELLDANSGAIAASRAMAVSNAGHINALDTAINNFSGTEKFEQCELRLQSMEKTLDFYRGVSHAD